jgi:hypothetical protein
MKLQHDVTSKKCTQVEPRGHSHMAAVTGLTQEALGQGDILEE